MNTYKYLRFIFLAIFTFLFSHYADAQSQKDFEKIFIKETEGKAHNIQLGSFKNVSKLSYYPDTLPAWFFSPPRSSADYLYAIGISDPDQTPEEANLQALHRAKAMAMLQNKCQIQYFRDVYTIESDDYSYLGTRQRFDTYFKISALGSIDSLNYTIVHKHFTRYNEAIILLQYANPLQKVQDNAPMMTATGTVLYIEAQIGDAFEPQAEYEMLAALKSPKQPLTTSQFTYREKGNRFLVISEFSGKKVEYPLHIYRYSNPSWAPNTHPLTSYNGLWSIYTQNFLRYLTLSTEQSSRKIKNLGEMYDEQISNLTREVAIKTAKIFINGIEFGEEDFDFDINIQEIY